VIALPSARPIDGPEGYRHLALDDVGSTNTVALDAFLAGDPGRLWVTAQRQLQGRARRGRSWISEPGNLYASLLLVDPVDGEKLASLPLIVSLSLVDAIGDVCPGIAPRLSIKWPNDLLLDGAKLSGILLEARTDDSGRRGVVIGCGVNCMHHPADTQLYRATNLAEAGADCLPEALFRALALRMDRAVRQWQLSGFAPFRQRWINLAAGIGKAITVNLPYRSLQGRFDDLDGDGYLLLRNEQGGITRVTAGDVFFPPAIGDE
jgi:BirA family biotin operon repressor/biotin-[acetyl-CoA-carboxylase] ligase